MQKIRKWDNFGVGVNEKEFLLIDLLTSLGKKGKLKIYKLGDYIILKLKKSND